MTQDEVAIALGATSWSALLMHVDNGGILVTPSVSLRGTGGAWESLRVQSDLVQVRRGMTFAIGRRSSFSKEELAPDLLILGVPNTYDDPMSPVACARGEANADRVLAETKRLSTGFRRGRWQIAVTVLAFGIVCFGAAVSLVEVPAISLPLMLLGCWAFGMGWLQAGDLMQETDGRQPWWSFRTSRLARWMGLSPKNGRHEV